MLTVSLVSSKLYVTRTGCQPAAAASIRIADTALAPVFLFFF